MTDDGSSNGSKLVVAAAVVLIGGAAVQSSAQESGPAEVQVGSAMGVFAKLVGDTWVRERTRETGEIVRVEIRYTKGTSPLSVYLDVRIWVDGTVLEDMHGIIVQHPRTGRVVMKTVNSLSTLQEGEEIESSGSHVVMNGVAYHPEGEADHWVWTVRCDNPDEYIDQIMVFGDGAWQENAAARFTRIRRIDVNRQ